jgi:hypothetical protein
MQSERGQFGRLKKVMRYLFAGTPELSAACQQLVKAQPAHMTSQQLLDSICEQVQRHWQPGGPRQQRLVSHMSIGKKAVPAGAAAVAAAAAPAAVAAPV